jgi:hypothetical protein
MIIQRRIRAGSQRLAVRSESIKRQLQELNDLGYTPFSRQLAGHFYQFPEEASKYARLSWGKFAPEQSLVELFGQPKIMYYYDPLRKVEFEKHLESIFRSRNPASTQKVATAFTKRLHDQGLHWSECCDIGSHYHGTDNPRNNVNLKLVCLRCGAKTHVSKNCPERPKNKKKNSELA